MNLRESRAWRALFRHPLPGSAKERVSVIASALFLHLHPARVRESAIKIRHTFCLGGITAFLFFVEAVTGIFLMFYYHPSPEHAYQDMEALREIVSFGILRDIHRWAGHLMVITVFLHMVRVFITGAYKPPREFNWIVGVLLLALTLSMSFTGYLLPWDQVSLWAVTVASRVAASLPFLDVRPLLLGDTVVSGAALLRFYVLHCVALPVLAILLMAIHFWRIRKDGGLAGPL
jgi:cytochrome b6